MMRVTLFTRRDCHLCEQTKEVLGRLEREHPHELIEVDIDTEAALLKRYKERVPVVQVGPYTLEAPITELDLRVTLGAAEDGMELEHPSEAVPRDWGIRLNKGLHFFSRHWLAIFNLIAFLYVGLPFTAPVLMESGARKPAEWIYRIYAPFCHQLAYRSWFMYGEQPAYPLESAGMDLVSFEEATGVNAGDYWASRDFVGNPSVGFKVALCERDVAIYGGILFAGLVFGFFRRHLKPLPIALWFLFGIVPIAIDGGSQFLSFVPFLSLPVRESTPLLRTITGGLFGVANVWMAYPYVEESMEEIRTLVAAKLVGAREITG
jgi:uncharacterized membrane protein/glutaredoxin